MGRFTDALFGRIPDPVTFQDAATEIAARFAVDAGSIPAQIFGLESYADPIAAAPRVARREAIQLPAIKRARDLICGSIGGLPLVVTDADRETRDNELMKQPEQGFAPSVTMARTVEDLLFEGVAYWRVTERSFDGYPRWVKRVEPWTVDINSDTGEVWVSGVRIAPRDLIQFHSPNDPLLVAGARAIRTCLRLDSAAANYADGAPPIDYFTPVDGADPVDDTEVETFLGAWKNARRARGTAYVPAALKYNTGGWNPEQLQLADARQHAVLEIARLTGIDAEDLSVSTTSRTYQNGESRRQFLIDMVLGPYAHAIEERLSLGDVTKRNYRVRFDFDGFMRADAKTRYEAIALGLEVGAIDQSEVREMEGKPALSAPAPRPLPAAPAPAPTEDAA